MKAGRPLTHGMSGTPIYKVWERLVRESYDGVSEMDPRWVRAEAFLVDMMPRPVDHALRRIDKTLPYSKDNCRWVHKNDKRNIAHE